MSLQRLPRRPVLGLALGFLASVPFFASTASADEPLPQILIEPPPVAAPTAPPVAAPTAVPPSSPAPSPPAPSPPAPSPPAPPTLRTHRYGWQTLTVDAAAMVLVVSSGVTGVWGGVGGLGVYAVGPPIVHMAHGHLGTGVADLGLRVGLPLIFGAIGYSAGDPHCHGDGFFCLPPAVGDAVIGGLIGYAGAVFIDAVFLAQEDVAVPAAPPPRERALLNVVPDLELRKDRQTVGLRGTF